jgi:hypothetical protein
MSIYSQTLLQDSPLAYWRLGELSGTSAADVQGIAGGTYSGTYTLGQAGAVASDNNPALALGGSGSVSVPNVAALNPSGSACTLECWVKTTNASLQHLIGGYHSPDNLGYGLATGAGATGKASYWSGGGNGGNWFESASSVNNGAWHHLAVVVSASATIIYIDGAADATLSGDLRPTSYAGTRALGARSDGSFALTGMLDEVAIYGSALSAARIAAHYQAGVVTGMLAAPVGGSPFMR